jgi:MFS family permease
MLIALLWFTFTREIWGAYLFAAVLGIGYGGCTAQMSPLIAKLFGLTSHGVIFGVATAGFTIGAAIGPFVSGYIFDTTGEYNIAFLACIILMFIGLIFNMLIKPTRIKVIGRL